MSVFATYYNIFRAICLIKRISYWSCRCPNSGHHKCSRCKYQLKRRHSTIVVIVNNEQRLHLVYLQPNGIDFPSTISTGSSLVAGLLAGDQNFGKVLGDYAGKQLEIGHVYATD